MTPKLKKIIIAIVVLGILFLLYTVFLKPDPEGEVLVVGRNSSGGVGAITSQDTAVLASQISQALLKIEQITLHRAIFDDPIFVSLEDRSQPIVDEPIGRTNPFAPLGDTSVNVTTRTNLNMGSSTPATTTPSVPATGAPVIVN